MPARPAAATVIRDMRKLLTPHARAIGRPAGPARDDAVDPASVEGTPAALKNDLIQLVGQDQVLHRVSDLVRYAALARGWGCRAVDVETTEELEQEFKTALSADTTTVIVVRTQPQKAML